MSGATTGTDTVRRTNRWRGLAGAALTAGAVGLFARRPALLAVCAAGVALVAYARFVAPPPATVTVVRSVDDADPDPGDEVQVEVTVENSGARTIPQLAFADGVPPTLDVVDGSASVGTALRPGAAVTVSYAVEAREGTHDFGPASVVTRDVVGVAERERTVAAGSDDAVTSRPADRRLASDVLPTFSRVAGSHPTDAAGAGLTFRTVREYRRGDPLARVDWARRARTGDLATVEFQAEQRATVVLVVDGRQVAALSPEPTAPTARQRSFEAATTLYEVFAERGYSVGVAALGPDAEWLPPGRGATHGRRARNALVVPESGVAAESTGRDWGAWLTERLPVDAVALVLTPLCDDDAVTAVERLRVAGHRVRVVSPDATATDTPGQVLAGVERGRRLSELRADRVSVLDWQRGVPLAAALADSGWVQ